MIAYNKESLFRFFIKKNARQALRNGYIDQLTFDNLAARKPGDLHTPGIFARIGMFLVTLMAMAFGWSLIGLLFLDSLQNTLTPYAYIFIVGAVTIGVLELLIRKERIYKSGIDDALIVVGCASLAGCFTFLDDYNPAYVAIVAGLITTAAAIRYVDSLMAVTAWISLIASLFLLLESRLLAILPFTIMIISLAGYLSSTKILKQKKFTFYHDGLTYISIAALATFYASGNYYVIKTLSPGAVPVPWFFWIFTVSVPVVLIALGLKKKDVILLRSGLLFVAAAVFTVRYFYSVLPPATAMIIAGAVLLGLSWFLIRYLQVPRNGITYEPVADSSSFEELNNIGGLVISQTFGGSHASQSNTNVDFGGGSGGGGGASGSY